MKKKFQKTIDEFGSLIRKKKFKIILFSLIGMCAGLIYYYFIGCNAEGGCPITGNPVNSALYGFVLGLILSL